MIIYANDDDDSGYKSDNTNSVFSSIVETVEDGAATTTTTAAKAIKNKKIKKLSKRALPTVTGTHLSAENKIFLKQLGFKLKHAESEV